ncbi:tyrosine-type recombinase/integrase [Micromonospora sp. NPDC050686]|uniref:tyrosine-type recombinase/integrase n=1 Tax=Micromonospora sp. NPDC050686 TaxID=3154631 RepID=UPI0033C4E616
MARRRRSRRSLPYTAPAARRPEPGPHHPDPRSERLILIFTTRLGTPVEPRNFHRKFKTRCRKAGVREISVHTTRRTCATLLVALDVHPRDMMRILRHSQIALTMNIYSEATSEAAQAALKRLGGRLDPCP